MPIQTKGEEMLNLDFSEKCINFVVPMHSDLMRVAFLFVFTWKSSEISFKERKPSFNVRKITSKERISKTHAQEI